MAGVEDVEALLDSTAKEEIDSRRGRPSNEGGGNRRDGRHRETSRDRERRMRDRSRERRNRELFPGVVPGRNRPPGRFRQRSRSADRDGFRRPPPPPRAGDFYRGGGRPRRRSRSPDGDRYRPVGRRERDPPRPRREAREGDDFIPLEEPGQEHLFRGRDDHDNRRIRTFRGEQRDREERGERGKKDSEPQATDEERDRRTVFVQQLAARLKMKELSEFFNKCGPVKDAQIVKDRVSGRSKGVGYVEFKNEESVAKAIKLTGQKLLGIPIIAQLTEAEKNRLAKTNEHANGNTNSVPYHRLYVGNIHFSITEEDLLSVFGPFGELAFTQLQKDDSGRSRGYGFVQFLDPENAKEALEKMNGFELAGRPIRVGLGNDKFTPESTQSLLQKFGNHAQKNAQAGFDGSAFSGAGGRGAHAGGGGGAFGRGHEEKPGAGASALDDSDIAGVNFSHNYSRDQLMRKLLRDEDMGPIAQKAASAKEKKAEPPKLVPSRCIILRNMFDPAKETAADWVKVLEKDIRGECHNKYGPVVHIHVDPNTKGDVHIAFTDTKSGENALKSLNGRYFGGMMITASPVVEAVYKASYPNLPAATD